MGLTSNPEDLPDLNTVSTQTWCELDFPLPDLQERDPVPIVIRRSALEEIQAHGQSRRDVEVCGVLVGECCRDSNGPFLHLQAVIRGEQTDNQLAQVTFTAATWDQIHLEMERLHVGKRILGWYHTHPGFGIFLSPMDLFIQEHFFSSGEQLALVYDPLSQEQGLFAWQQGQALLHSFLVEEDLPADPRSAVAGENDSDTITATESRARSPGRGGHCPQIPRRGVRSVKLLLVVAGLVLVMGLVIMNARSLRDWFRTTVLTEDANATARGESSEADPIKLHE